MPTEFTIIGEHREDRTQLLVVGADGEYYSYMPTQEQFAPTELDETWIIHDAPPLEFPDQDSDELEMI